MRLEVMLLAISSIIFVVGCAGTPAITSYTSKASPLCHLQPDDTAETAFSRALEFEADGAYGDARTLYNDVKAVHGREPTASDDGRGAENYTKIIDHRLVFLSCEESSNVARHFSDRAELTKKITDAVKVGSPEAIAALLACESVRGATSRTIEPPQMPTVQATWLAEQRKATLPPGLLPFSTLNEIGDADSALIATTGYRDYRQLLFDLRRDKDGWIWWATFGGDWEQEFPARYPKQEPETTNETPPNPTK